MVIGWVGNSEWHNQNGEDPKGLRTILLPALEKLAASGIDTVQHFADRNVKWRAREEMPAYYSEIDVLICVSAHEGTPNPVLEAVACGVPVISTDVGIVREVLGKEQANFILAERSVDAVFEALATLHRKRDLLGLLSSENLLRRGEISWHVRMYDWMKFFRDAKKRNEQSQTLKKSMLRMIVADALRRTALAPKKKKRLRDRARNVANSVGSGLAKLGQLSPPARS